MIVPDKSFWDIFKNTDGALSCSEAIALYNIALSSPNGLFLELGSHKGKSSQCIALAVSKLKEKGTFIAVEPEFSNEEWRNNFIKIIGRMLPASGFCYHIDYSLNVIPKYDNYSFVFIDSGSHSDDLVMSESKMLEDKIEKDGIICYHDKGSQFIRVDEAYKYLLSTGKYEEIKIDWRHIFDYVKENNLEEGNQSWHQYPDLPHPPNFIGAVIRK